MKLLAIMPFTFFSLRNKGDLSHLFLTAKRQGWDIHVASPYGYEKSDLPKTFTEDGVSFYHLGIAYSKDYGLKYTLLDLLNFFKTSILLIKLRPDAVFCHLRWPTDCFGSVLSCAVFKTVTAVYFSIIHREQKCRACCVRRLKIMNRYRRRNQKWIVHSKSNRRVLCDLLDIAEEDIPVVYESTQAGYEIADLEPAVRACLRSEVRKELGLPEKSRLLLTVAHLYRRKGYSLLTEAVKPVADEFQDVRFVWAGDGKYRDDFLERIRKYGISDKLLSIGYRGDISRLLWASDLFIFPTRNEGGLSRALLEAMVHGLPVVTSDAAGICEVFDGGIHAVVFKTGRKEELCQAIRWALLNYDRMKEMAEKARLKVREFSNENKSRKIIDIIMNAYRARV